MLKAISPDKKDLWLCFLEVVLAGLLSRFLKRLILLFITLLTDPSICLAVAITQQKGISHNFLSEVVAMLLRFGLLITPVWVNQNSLP